MAAIRFGLIGRYLRPYRRTVLLGVAALVVVNLLSVALPLLVRGVIDDLQDGFTFSDVLRQAALIIALATASAAKWRRASSSRSSITCCARNPAGCRPPAAAR